MLKRIKIENLRGIREGEIDGLTRLVVLVGPNGSGKSTVLEAAFIGGSPYPANAVGFVVERRTHTRNGARWLIRGGDPRTTARVEAVFQDGMSLTRRVQWQPMLRDPEMIRALSERALPGPFSAFLVNQNSSRWGELAATTAMATNNEYKANDFELAPPPPYLRLIEPSMGHPLHDLFSRAVQAGWRDYLVQSAKAVVSGLQGIEILTEEGEPRLFLTFETGAVPASLAGDGVQALLRMTFELASPFGGTILLEEPEVHMHPRAMSACARAIVAATRRDVQVIMTTHSLELIDRLLSELTDEEVGDPSLMTLQKLRLSDGVLKSIMIPASDAEHARTSVEEDLR